MSLHKFLKRETDKEYTGFNYTYDGAYEPRVKGREKLKRSKQMRNKRKQIDKKEIKEHVNEVSRND